jgi:hypothetical protein
MTTDPEALVMFREAMEGKPGRPIDDDAKPANNGSRLTEHGNSKSYTLSRLKKQHPELFARVSGEQVTTEQAPPELAALLDDPNMLPSQREALQLMLATTMALEALAAEKAEP